MKWKFLTVALLATLALAASPAAADPSLMWSEQIDGGGHYIDSGSLLSLTPDGQLLVGAQSTESTGGIDLYLRKLNKADGSEIWGYRYNGYDDKDVLIQDVTWDSAGQLVVAGYIAACAG